MKNLHRLLLNNLILAFTLFQYVKDHWGIGLFDNLTIYYLTIVVQRLSRGGE